jgi:hypothetical protein
MTRYLLRGVRISGLPLSQYCGLSAELGAQHGAGRAAALSSAFHAKASASPDAKEKLARLTPKELNEISMWKTPTPVKVAGKELTYEAAAKEQPVGLTLDGAWADEGEVITCGTLDFAWDLPELDMVAVADMKKTQWASSGPDSLQLLTYGYAWAAKLKRSKFVVGLWLIEEAEWRWSETVYDVGGFDYLDLWERIVYAARNNQGEASFGPHCGDCYSRLHCPEYTLPASLADSVLSPAALGGAIDDPIKLGEMLAFIRRIEPVIERAKEHAKEAARRGLTVTDPTTGETLKHISCQGRESLNQAKLFAAIPDATRFIERGQPYTQARWVKPLKAKAAKAAT